MADDHDRAGVRADLETKLRAESLVESSKGLLLINGGGAAAVAAFLGSTWDKFGAEAMRPWALAGIGVLLAGVAMAAILSWLRYRNSLDKPRSLRIGCSPYWRWLRNLTFLSVSAFLIGMGLVVFGALRVPTASAAAMQTATPSLAEHSGWGGDWLVAVATLVAAFGGTAAAYMLEATRRKREENRRNMAAVNHALYTLYAYWNVAIQYFKDVLEAYENKADGWLNANATVVPEDENVPINNGDLDFLLNTPKQGELFAQLKLQESRYRYMANMINRRSQAQRTVFRVLSDKGVKTGPPGLTPKQLEEHIGTDRVIELQILFGGLVLAVKEDMQAFSDAFKRLRETALQLYPCGSFIDVSFIYVPPKKPPMPAPPENQQAVAGGNA